MFAYIQRLSKSWYLMVFQKVVHPGKLTCPLKRDCFNRKYIFQPLIFRGHVSFRGSMLPFVKPYFEAEGLSGRCVAILLMAMFIPLVYDEFEHHLRWLLGTSFVNSETSLPLDIADILSSVWLLLKCIRKK